MQNKTPAITTRILLAGIRIYQQTLSPDHGPLSRLFPFGVCRFSPTCSQYASEAVSRHGWRGCALAIKRLLRCHPFTKGGHDPVPSSHL